MYLISFKDARFAYTFIDYMATKGIELTVKNDQEGNFQLFLAEHHIDQHELVQKELTEYLNNPYGEKYRDASWKMGKIQPTNTKFATFKNNNLLPKLIKTGMITTSITVICLIVYLVSLIFNYWVVLEYLGFPFNSHYSSQIWRYFTPIFIHFGLLHIAFNLSWWWYLGGMVERFRGKFKLLEILIISGLLSNYAQYIVSGPLFGGLSGVVYALIGYVGLYGEKNKSSGIRLERAMFIFALLWLIGGYIGLLNGMANTAHLVGLAIGLLLAAKDIWLIKK